MGGEMVLQNATAIMEQLAAMEARTEYLEHRIHEDHYNSNAFWLLLGAYLVFFMQCGFALLEAGSVSAKNTNNILLKNVMDGCLGGLIWWAFGYAFAYGEGGAAPNKFIGGKDFFLLVDAQTRADESYRSDGTPQFSTWMFQWAFAATAATIVSGAVAERCRFGAYLMYSMFITGIIYPVVVHWVWSKEAWLSDVGGVTYIDFAGSSVIHMVGGCAALMGATAIGPRIGRFTEDGKVKPMPGQSTVFATTGTFILWFGWYGFNTVSTLEFDLNYIAEKVAVTTTLAACAGGTTTLLLSILVNKSIEITSTLNGILAGLVSITAPCAVVEPVGAFVIGVIGGALQYFGSLLLLKLRIDDPLEAAPVHLVCGIWGTLAVGFFATEFDTANVLGEIDARQYGVLYGGNGELLGVQALGVLCILAWSITTSAVVFFGLKKADMLRVSKEDELAGVHLSRRPRAPTEESDMSWRNGVRKTETEV